ncbi:MAG: hypothetical protein OK455_06015 [Thaumarchaeota archaeon]|nr:hypothetical protein [Nitrososphaerota archaeon]
MLAAATELEAELEECDDELAPAGVEDELDITLSEELMEVVELDELPFDNTK